MKTVGTSLAKNGFSFKELAELSETYRNKGCNTEFISLSDSFSSKLPEACILVLRQGVDFMLNFKSNTNNVMEELTNLDLDKYANMNGKVVNKRARYSLVFGEDNVEPDYMNKQGRIISWDDVPLLSMLRKEIGKLSSKTVNLNAEGNNYYNKTCGIGFHGDSERKIVVGARFGDEMMLEYQWFYKSKTIGSKKRIVLQGGDIYIMSEYATGYYWKDWNRRMIPVLRHAAGNIKYLTIEK